MIGYDSKEIRKFHSREFVVNLRQLEDAPDIVGFFGEVLSSGDLYFRVEFPAGPGDTLYIGVSNFKALVSVLDSKSSAEAEIELTDRDSVRCDACYRYDQNKEGLAIHSQVTIVEEICLHEECVDKLATELGEILEESSQYILSHEI